MKKLVLILMLSAYGQTYGDTGNVPQMSLATKAMEYAYIFSTKSPAPLKRTENEVYFVLFDKNGPITPGITYTKGSGDIVIKNPGTYHVSFSVSEAGGVNVYALSVNGNIIEGSRSMQAIITTTQNNSVLSISTSTGGPAAPAYNASVVIMQIG